MSQEKLLQVILGPHTSEKSTLVAEKNNQIVFKVLTTATKAQVKGAVEKLFDVKVSGVSVANMKGKEKRFGQKIGRRQNWKKAYVSLADGYDIDFAQAE